MCSRFQDVRIAKDPRDKFKPKELFTRESLAELDKIVAAKRARLEENIQSQELQAVRQAEEDKEADRLAQEMEQRRIDRAKAAEDRIARDKEKEEQEARDRLEAELQARRDQEEARQKELKMIQEDERLEEMRTVAHNRVMFEQAFKKKQAR